MSKIKQYTLTADGYTLCAVPHGEGKVILWINRYDEDAAPQITFELTAENAGYELARYLDDHLPAQHEDRRRYWQTVQGYAIKVVVLEQVRSGLHRPRRRPWWRRRVVVLPLAAVLLIGLALAAYRAGWLPGLARLDAEAQAVFYQPDGQARAVVKVTNRGLIPLRVRVADAVVYDDAGATYTSSEDDAALLFFGQNTTMELRVPLPAPRAVTQAVIEVPPAPPATAAFPGPVPDPPLYEGEIDL